MTIITFVVLISILSVCSSFSTNSFVWNTFVDNTGLNSTNKWYIYLIGLLNASFALSGYDGGCGIAEETKNASKSAPKIIIFTIVASAL